MNLVELDRALRKLRLSGMAAVLETRLRQAQTERLAPLDLVADARHRRTAAPARPALCAAAQAGALPRSRSLARQLRFRFQQEDESRARSTSSPPRASSQQREDALFLGPPGTGKSHLAQAIGRAAIQQGYRVIYREAHTLLEEIADADARRHPQGLPRGAGDRARC